jgi:hypothetical protein
LWTPPPPKEEEAEEVALPVEEYQPPDLSEQEAIRCVIEESELLELSHWVGLGVQLQASASTSRLAPPPPPPPAPEPEPQAGWGHSVWEETVHVPPIQVNRAWGYVEPQTSPQTPQASAPAAPWMPMVPWSFPWDPPLYIDITGDDNDDE